MDETKSVRIFLLYMGQLCGSYYMTLVASNSVWNAQPIPSGPATSRHQNDLCLQGMTNNPEELNDRKDDLKDSTTCC